MRPVRAMLLGTLAVLTPAMATAAQRLAVIPFQALERPHSARAAVMPAIEAALAAKGYEVVSDERVEEVLESERVRYLDSFTNEQLGSLLALVGADAAVFGTVLDFQPDGDATIALHVRVVAQDGTLWSDVYGLRASESAAAFGEGKATNASELVRIACARALEALPPAGRLRNAVRRPEASRKPRVVYRSRDAANAIRICVLPLENGSTDIGASRVVAAVLEDVLDRTPRVTVVQPAEMRAALVSTGIRNLAALTRDDAKALGAPLGTTLFLQGTIFRYDRGGADVELYLTLTDLATGRVLWSGLHRRRGEELETWRRPRGERDPVLVAERTAAELVRAFTSG